MTQEAHATEKKRRGYDIWIKAFEGDGEYIYQPRCICGWKGFAKPTYREAVMVGSEHRQRRHQ